MTVKRILLLSAVVTALLTLGPPVADVLFQVGSLVFEGFSCFDPALARRFCGGEKAGTVSSSDVATVATPPTVPLPSPIVNPEVRKALKPLPQLGSIAVLGHVDHGKSTLVSAISKVSSARYDGTFVPVDVVEKATSGNRNPLTIKEARVDIRSGRRSYTLVDFPAHSDVVKSLIAGQATPTAILLAVSVVDGPMPQTREHVLLAARLHVPHIIVALTKMDSLDGEIVTDADAQDALGARLYVSNVPVTATEAELRAHFGSTARATRVVLPVDPVTGRRRRYAFVEFASHAAASRIVKRLNGRPFQGRPLIVRDFGLQPDRGTAPRSVGLADLVELEVRDLMASHGFSATTVPIVRVRALDALRDEPIAVNTILNLMETIDRNVPVPRAAADQSLLMGVESVSFVSGRGSLVSGTIERGSIRVGDEIGVVGLGRGHTRAVAAISALGQQSREGTPGQYVSVLLGATASEVQPGQVLATPGSIEAHKQFEADVYVYTTEEGGRKTPFFNSSSSDVRIRTRDIPGTISLPAGLEMIQPGDAQLVTFRLSTAIAIEEGTRFTLRVDGRTVGAGVVTRIIR
jgi:translation elongation factor EF-Tu-like GTPase